MSFHKLCLHVHMHETTFDRNYSHMVSKLIGNQSVKAKKVHCCSNMESHIMKLKFYWNKVNF